MGGIDREHRQQLTIRVGMAVALVLLIGVGVKSFTDARREASATQWVAHTHEVLEHLHSLLNGLGTAEAALRGWSLSGDPTIVAEVEPAITLTSSSLTHARALLVDNAQQTQRLDAIAPLVDERLAMMHDRLLEIRAGARPPYSPTARALSDRIRHDTALMIETERELLAVRSRERSAVSSTAQWTLPAAMATAIVLLLIVFFLLNAEMVRRRRSEQRVQARLDEMRVLGRMNELLASCRQVDEAWTVVGNLAPSLFHDVGGSVSLFRASRDLLERHAQWGDQPTAEFFAPDDCWCLRRGQPHRFDGSAKDEHAVACKHHGDAFKGHAYCVPLLAHGEVIGTLQLVSAVSIDDDVARVAVVVGENVALAIANLQLRETLRNQSLRDPLTGLFNRRYVEETFVRELGRAARNKEPLSLLALDVDHFKRFNDTFGHDAGDLVLKSIAAVLTEKTRGSDVAARLGGEELCVLLPGAATEDAFKRGEDIRKAIAALELKHQGAVLGRVTTSIGIATAPQHATTVEDLMRAADRALYRAKHEGRDRVIVS